jgi:hypothetical protein
LIPYSFLLNRPVEFAVDLIRLVIYEVWYIPVLLVRIVDCEIDYRVETNLGSILEICKGGWREANVVLVVSHLRRIVLGV